MLVDLQGALISCLIKILIQYRLVLAEELLLMGAPLTYITQSKLIPF